MPAASNTSTKYDAPGAAARTIDCWYPSRASTGHGVEQRAVDDGAEPAVVAAERTDIGDLETGVAEATLGGLSAGQLDGGGRKIQPDGGVTQFGQVQGHGGLAAADVENVAVELALLDQGGDLRLRFADAPWRLCSRAELGNLSPVGGFEREVWWCSHAPVYINLVDICQYS